MICEEVNTMRAGATCTKVTIQESEGNIATYNKVED